MSHGRTERITLLMEPDLIERIDDFSFANRIRTRAGAMRHLVQVALSANEKSAAEGATSPRHDHNPTSEVKGREYENS